MTKHKDDPISKAIISVAMAAGLVGNALVDGAVNPPVERQAPREERSAPLPVLPGDIVDDVYLTSTARNQLYEKIK